MTVGELIEALRAFDPSTRVLVNGYEMGYEDPSAITLRQVHQVWESRSVLGRYDDADSWQEEHRDEWQDFDAVIILR